MVTLSAAVARLQASLGLISPGWILFEGTVIRKQRETERGGENRGRKKKKINISGYPDMHMEGGCAVRIFFF